MDEKPTNPKQKTGMLAAATIYELLLLCAPRSPRRGGSAWEMLAQGMPPGTAA